MAKYYNADTLLEFVKNNTPTIEGQTTLQCVERAINEAPTADVREVKRGHWVSNRPNPDAMKKFHELGIGKAMSIHSVYWTCSECGTWGTPSGKFCSECGADMRGEV